MHKDPTPWFVGWSRPHAGAPWEEQVSTYDYDGCWSYLLDLAVTGDKLVLPKGVDPNNRQTAK
jgi:hypothetical protein